MDWAGYPGLKVFKSINTTTTTNKITSIVLVSSKTLLNVEQNSAPSVSLQLLIANNFYGNAIVVLLLTFESFIYFIIRSLPFWVLEDSLPLIHL